MAKVRSVRRGRRPLSSMPLRYMRKRPFSSLAVPRLPLKRRRVGGGSARRIPVVQPGLRRRRGVARKRVGGDMTMSKKNWKPYKGLFVKKVVRNLLKQSYTAVLRFQGCNRMNANNDGVTMPGYFILHNTYDVTLGAGSYCPLHMFELTSVLQGTNQADAVGYQMTVNDGGAVIFTNHYGTTAQGNVDSSGIWQGERCTGTFYPSGPGERYWTTHWFDIRLNLYGCNTQPTIYDVMLVQPTEAWAVRDAADSTFVDARRNFWQGMVKGMTYNPIIPGNNGWRKGCRVIRRWRKIIQPGSPFGSTDIVDKNPFNHVLRIKYYDGKTRDHQWIESSPVSDTVALGQQWIQTDGSNATLRNMPKPRARLYLIVRALNTTPVAAGSVTAANTPSYDIIIRKKVSAMLQ